MRLLGSLGNLFVRRRILNMCKHQSDSPLIGTAGNDEPSDTGLDWYDRLLTQTFPASDALPLW